MYVLRLFIDTTCCRSIEIDGENNRPTADIVATPPNSYYPALFFVRKKRNKLSNITNKYRGDGGRYIPLSL